MTELTNERDAYKFPMHLRFAMERAATVLKNCADVQRRELDEDSQALVRNVLDELDAACAESNLAARRATPSSEGTSLGPLPEPEVLGFDREDHDICGYTAEQVEQIRRDAVASGREYQHKVEAKLIERLRAQLAHLRAQGHELAGVITDVEQGHGFDDVCLETVKRVRSQLARQSQEPAGKLVEHCEFGDLIHWYGEKPPEGTDLYAAPTLASASQGQAERVAVPVQRMYMDELDAGTAGEEWLAHHIPGAASLHRSPEPSGGQSPRVRWVALFDRNDRLTYGYMLTRDIMNWTQITFIDAAPAHPVAQPAKMRRRAHVEPVPVAD
jgi:hypothetical protein